MEVKIFNKSIEQLGVSLLSSYKIFYSKMFKHYVKYCKGIRDKESSLDRYIKYVISFGDLFVYKDINQLIKKISKEGYFPSKKLMVKGW